MSEETRPLILHVIHHLVTGGMENGLVNLIDSLPEASFRHAVVCIEDFSEFRDRLRRPDVEVIALHRSRVGIWPLRRRLYRLCRRLKPAIVHTRNLSGLDALLPARFAGVPHAVHGEHGWDVNNLHGEKWKPALIRRLHSPLVDRYITVSRDLKRYLVGRVRIKESRIVQIYNGVDTERFAPAVPKPIGTGPSEWMGEGVIVVGTVGRIQPVKDQATLVRAFAELINRRGELRSRLRLAVVGDGPLSGAMRELVHSLGIAGLTWLPGTVSNVPDVLRALDVFVLPSLNEGISNTILEAMASCLPVVATAVGGNVEIVEDGRTGHLFAPGDIAALARHLESYIDQPALRESHAVAARRRAIDVFGLATMVERYRAVYEALLRRESTCRA